MKKLISIYIYIFLQGAILFSWAPRKTVVFAQSLFSELESEDTTQDLKDRQNSVKLSSWHPSSVPFPTTREPWKWPFDPQSIWNLPLKSQATYQPANIQAGFQTSAELELLYRVSQQDPLTRLYAPGSWTHRCDGTNSPTSNPAEETYIRFPQNQLIPDANPPHTPNNSAAILQPDGQTIISISSTARCQPKAPIYGWYAGEENIYGMGITGSSGGSGLSTLGGTIRLGELTNNEPIRHVLRINVWGEKYLHFNPKDQTPGYRWPASTADSYAAFQYGGVNPQLEMGSLLAIPPNITPQSLGLKSLPALKLFYALQNYGAYIADDTAWDVTAFSVQEGVPEEFEQTYGYEYETDDSDSQWFKEYYALVESLHIVDSNPAFSKKDVTRLAPLAPPFIDRQNNR